MARWTGTPPRSRCFCICCAASVPHTTRAGWLFGIIRYSLKNGGAARAGPGGTAVTSAATRGLQDGRGGGSRSSWYRPCVGSIKCGVVAGGKDCPGPWAPAPGRCSRQTGRAAAQRGWKAQPAGRSSGLGTSPFKCVRVSAAPGRRHRDRADQRGGIVVPRPGRRLRPPYAISTMRPRYMTATWVEMNRTELRSCEM